MATTDTKTVTKTAAAKTTEQVPETKEGAVEKLTTNYESEIVLAPE